MSSSSSQPLDFAALLARDYRPARLAQIIPKERSKALLSSKTVHTNHVGEDATNRQQLPSHAEYANEDRLVTKRSSLNMGGGDHNKDDNTSKSSSNKSTEALLTKLQREEKANRLVLQLVAKTPAYKKHLRKDDDDEIDAAARLLWNDRTESDLKAYIPNPPVSSVDDICDNSNGDDDDENDDGNVNADEGICKLSRLRKKKIDSKNYFSPLFHQVELGDWESKIEWEGYKPSLAANNASVPDRADSSSPNDPTELLRKRRNPFLENISFENLISWTGEVEDLRKKAQSVPLILELGVAGQSIATHVLPSHRPTPYANTDEYQARMESSMRGEIKSTADLSKGTLHANKEEMERLIEQRQRKRRQMAKDKTSRVTEAISTLGVLGGGRGRTITSSLMGPGGTERTGRPSRHVGAGMHETEYIEQLDMTVNHALFRDLSKVLLRQYHRPKLPYRVVRTTLAWQFCIRCVRGNKRGVALGTPTAGGSGENSSSWGHMMGAHAGAISKAKLHSEADLTPTEGKLVLLEYSEEKPPLQMTKGMASKIVTYYRGDKSKCPVSAGGGDRPTRRKRQGNDTQQDKNAGGGASNTKDLKVDKPPRLVGPDKETSITDWVGKMPKKSKEERKNEAESINVLPEGVTEILHPKTHGPFIGEIEDGQAVTGLISNLFVAPIFQQEPESTDFLMILGKNSGQSIPGRRETLNVVLRDLPRSTYTVGQVEPRARVYGPGTQGEKNFFGNFFSYQVAKYLTRLEAMNAEWPTLEDVKKNVLTSAELNMNNIRSRMKPIAFFPKDSNVWILRRIGDEGYPGVDALGKSISPESVATYEVANATTRRLNDLGIHVLFNGSHAVTSVGVMMIYLAGQVNATKEQARKMKKLAEMSKSNKSLKSIQGRYYEEAAAELEAVSKSLRQRHEVAKFIYEELQLAPWNLCNEFLDVHKKGEGTGMMKLTGLGDPSGIGEGFSFLREADTKPSKSVGAGSMGQTAQMKKITGTEDDLRKLTMKQMGRILKSYGMAQKQIDTLKRWDRVHVIRDLSTKAASDGIGDGLERFARGEKMKLAEQKQMYRDRINLIWKREIAALSGDISEGRVNADGGDIEPSEAEDGTARATAQKKQEETAKEDSDSESDDDDFAADLEEEMMDRTEANQLVAGQTGGVSSLGQLRNATQDVDLSRDARELAALKRQREEERVAQEGMAFLTPTEKLAMDTSKVARKVIRKRVTKTFPDGRSVTTFKFVVHSQEVGQIMARLTEEAEKGIFVGRRSHVRPDYMPDEKQIGHALFEDEDDFDFRGGRSIGGKKKVGGRRGRSPGSAQSSPRKKDLQIGKLKKKVSSEQRIKKRKREEDEMEVYQSMQRRQGTSNRKERGSIRDRRPHVVFSSKLEEIRSAAERRPTATPFHKPVNPKHIPRYYEIISNPMDLSSIRDKISKYEYRSGAAMLKDFALMRSNAIKFNGTDSVLAQEAGAIFEFVQGRLEANKAELTHLEEAVANQLDTSQPKKKRKKVGKKGTAGSSSGGTGNTGGADAFLGTLPTDLNLDDLEFSDDDSD